MDSVDEIKIKRTTLVVTSIALLFTVSCNKLVQVPNPISSVTANQVFSSDATATAAMTGIYSFMSNGGGPSGVLQTFSNSTTSAYLGESADELTDQPAGLEFYDDFLVNNLSATIDGGTVLASFWQPAYYDIYSANAIITALQSSIGVSLGTRNQLTGEAKFIRALCYFYLTNICGDVPLDLTPDFNQTVLLTKSPQAQVYRQITSDLVDAQSLMINDFSLSNGMPIRANKWVAMALLARVYQYRGIWDSAYLYSSAVINSGEFQLVSTLTNVFLANSPEAILQLQTVNAPPWATWEGYQFIPNPNAVPTYWLTSKLINAFEPGDQRWSSWVGVDSINFNNLTYYYPYKYEVQNGQGSYPAAENYTVLRLAEQYLIRAEAETNLKQLGSAINDLDTIRSRAGLANLDSSLTESQVEAAVQQEYRIEFFAEWGHRWLDLKRWSMALDTLGTIPYKQAYISTTQLLYPIPKSEIQDDPNLTQNPGYN